MNSTQKVEDNNGHTLAAEEIQLELVRLKDENQKLKADLDLRNEKHSKILAMEMTVDTLLDVLVKLRKGRSNFCSEFLGRQNDYHRDSYPSFASTGEKAKEFLLDSNISTAESDLRQEMLKRAAEETLLHVVGLLEGYRNSVVEGAHKIIRNTDPDVIAKELPRSKLKIGKFEVSFRYLPFIFELKLLQLCRRKSRELLEEDSGRIEKEFFRPVFISNYKRVWFH